jgi:magnesium chelatase accessory protein
MSSRPNWATDGQDWPHREASRFVEAGGLRWHVQTMGAGPVALLLHGTGAASHSFAGLMPHLAERFTVIVPDLPGHGFTDMPPLENLALPAMAGAVETLLCALHADPALVAGHSAGAAILVRMCLDDAIAPRLLVSLNGAILPLHGVPGRLFAPLASLFVKSGFMPKVFAWRARHTDLVPRLMRDTGSTLEPADLEPYAMLARHAGHIEAAIGMMARWDLNALEPELMRLRPTVQLIAGANDRMIAPSQSLRLRRMLPGSRLELLPGLGHLAHEEAPERIAALIVEAYDQAEGGAPAKQARTGGG